MISEEFKKVLELSGGKVIISDGEVKNSYVVMKLADYLKEKTAPEEGAEIFSEQEAYKQEDREDEGIFLEEEDSLTDKELLDRINADIERLRLSNSEKNWEDNFVLDNLDGGLQYESLK